MQKETKTIKTINRKHEPTKSKKYKGEIKMRQRRHAKNIFKWSLKKTGRNMQKKLLTFQAPSFSSIHGIFKFTQSSEAIIAIARISIHQRR